MPATDTSAASPPAADELAGWLRLQLTPGVGLLSARRLLAHFGSPAAIFAAGHAGLRPLLRHEQALALSQPSAALLADVARQLDATLAWLARPGHHVLSQCHPAYPAPLRQLPNPPLLLFVVGQPAWLARPALAIVGSRNASAQGVQNAERFAATLSAAGLTIVSGLALGIDGAAHAGGLRGAGSTVAVVGTGADRVYPASHAALARRIAEDGAIVSEYLLGTPPAPANFPLRNRLISALARGVLVVEAAAGSGSLITAALAAEQGREVFAIPGSIHASLSKGCNQLIRDGATLVETAADVLAGLQLAAPPRAPADAGFVDPLLEALGADPADAGALAGRLGLALAEVQAQLLALELAGLLERLPGGKFQRLWG